MGRGIQGELEMDKFEAEVYLVLFRANPSKWSAMNSSKMSVAGSLILKYSSEM